MTNSANPKNIFGIGVSERLAPKERKRNQILPGIIILCKASPEVFGLEKVEENTVEPKPSGRAASSDEEKAKERKDLFLCFVKMRTGRDISTVDAFTRNIMIDAVIPFNTGFSLTTPKTRNATKGLIRSSSWPSIASHEITKGLKQ